MDVAQLYMLALRPSGVPIVGESAANLPFKGQVEISKWSWDFHNLEEKKKGKDAPAGKNKLAEEVTKLGTIVGEKVKTPGDIEASFLKSLDTQVKSVKTAADASLEELGKLKEAAGQETPKGPATESEAEADEETKKKNFSFKFSKRVDVSTTQLLNCMKAGDVLPVVTLTMHQSSSNTPWSLVITVTKVRLLKYSLQVETSDTMTDMTEDWECDFASFGYVYQNRPHAGVKSLTAGGAVQTAAKAATQGTVRTFMMTNISNPFG